MRAVAILAVIVCHSSEAVYAYTAGSIGSAALPSQIIAVGLFTLGRLGVPLFLFMTGYLMLDREYDKQACFKFWKTKWLGLVIATEIWIVIYDVFLHFVRNSELTLELLLKNMLFLQNVNMGHMWYMSMILGLYLLLPIMANGLKRIDDARVLAFPLLLGFAILFVAPTLSTISQSMGGDPVHSELTSGFIGGTYGFYVLVGYCLKKGVFNRIGTATAICASIAFFALTIFEQIFAYGHGLSSPVWYTDALLFCSGFFLFLSFSKMRSAKVRPTVAMLAKYSFALYLVHFPIRILLTPWVATLGLPLYALQVIVLTIAVLIISLIICVVVAHIPKLGRWVLYMR